MMNATCDVSPKEKALGSGPESRKHSPFDRTRMTIGISLPQRREGELL
jgi:hypothetical protein